MSNTLAIAAVTEALRHLLEKSGAPLPGEGPGTALSGIPCTALTPDRVRGSSANPVPSNQLNVFLYQIAPNAALRNQPMPIYGHESDPAPLALDLYYLLTAYGDGSSDLTAHRLLGRAMAILHARGRLERDDILAASMAAGNNLADYVERLRITPHPLSTEEMSKLWTTFQSAYRISVAYQISVVLIQNAEPATAPLPVLTRGRAEHPGSRWSAPAVFPSLLRASPTLTDLLIEEALPGTPLKFAAKPAARIAKSPQTSSRLTLRGHHLDVVAPEKVVAELTTAALQGAVNILAPLADGTAEQIQFQLPAESDKWPAGFYSILLSFSKGTDKDRRTNALSFTLAPRILEPPTTDTQVDANITITVTFAPKVQPYQRVTLLVGDREFNAPAHPNPVDTLSFVDEGIPPGQHWVRLRVDGIESLIVADYGAEPAVFDGTQRVTVT